MENINTIVVFDEEDKKAVDVLRKHALDDTEAAILWLLNKEGDMKSIDIERTLYIRQPTASVNLASLKDRKFVDFRKTSNPGKGRPTQVWFLTKTMKEIIRLIQKETEAKIKTLSEEHEELEKIAAAV
ncbi:MAG: hypothetical protein U9P44_03455 [archaeon]|nr:hypothetical protein [archaeon]